jgi:serine O-acetyltransferase
MSDIRGDTPLQCLKADVVRAYGRFSARALAVGLLRERTLRPVVTMRLCQAAQNIQPATAGTALGFILRGFHRWFCSRAGIDLAWNTVIGAGFRVTHGWGLVVTPSARVGRNVTVFHGVTIGQRDEIADDGTRTTSYPTIEDDVWIGPHAVIIGGVNVGHGSRIAPQTTVVTDVPPRAIVGGNPMRLLRENAPLDVVNRVEFAREE